MANIGSTVSELSPAEKRALLAEKLRAKARQPREAPLSFSQQRLWFLDRLEPGQPRYNIPMAVRLRGPLNFDALRASLNAIVGRHESLRTRFFQREGELIQRVGPPEEIELRLINLEATAPGQQRAELDELLRQEARRPFDLEQDLMIRAVLYRLGIEDHVLLLNMHHIASDEWSVRVLFRELSALYTAAVRKQQVELPPLPLQYADFALWQRRYLNSGRFTSDLEYWKKQLTPLPPRLGLPTDRRRPPRRSHAGTLFRRPLDRELRDAVHRFATHADATPFMVLLGAYQLLLARHTSGEDLIVGSPIAGRSRLETEGLIGFFVNTLVLRADLSGRPSFRVLVQRVRETVLQALTHQDLPFEKVVEEVQPERVEGDTPLIETMFALQNGFTESFPLPELTLSLEEVDTGTSKFDLTFVVEETSEGYTAIVEYDTELFDPETVDRWITRYESLLRNALARPDESVWRIPILLEDERRMLVEEWNQTAREYPRDATVSELFEAQVHKTPDAVAVRYPGEKALTYGELNRRANRLAHFLRDCGVQPGDAVAICAERSVPLIVGFLAILKAGGAYVPIDSDFPRERIEFMIRDSQARLILVQDAKAPLFSGLESNCDQNGEAKGLIRMVRLEGDAGRIAQFPDAKLERTSAGDRTAYVIYTSGSTGEPKGVMVPHRAISRLVLSTDYVQIGPGDGVAQASNISFDAATFEVWGALLNGATLVGLPQEKILAPRELYEVLSSQGVTILFLTTALFNQIAQTDAAALRSLKSVLFGGEAVDPRWVREVLQQGPPQRLLHVYGPTETTTFASWYLVDEVEPNARTVPIGRPIANTTIYVLNPDLSPVPIGVPGEIYVGGDGVALGYLNRDHLTEERFIRNPFASHQSRLYRTGDLGRFLPSGAIEFIGRVDQQVKLRGFRIELEEIASVLERVEGVQECLVRLREDRPGDKRLAAYWTASSSPPPSESDLRAELREKLPAYMIPAHFVRLERFPLNQNGKVDTAALPPPATEPERAFSQATDDPLEEQLIAIWQEVLGTSVRRDDDFFALGGHSLLAVRLFSLIEERLGHKLRLATLFTAPSVGQLAEAIRSDQRDNRESLIVEIEGQGPKPPLFWIHSLGGDGGGGFFYYRELARLLADSRASYGIRSPAEPFTDVAEMAKRYVRELRLFVPQGPYLLGGFCFGGVVAYEMARQMAAAGLSVGSVILLESAAPNPPSTWHSLRPDMLVPWLRNLSGWTQDSIRRGPRETASRISHRLQVAARRLWVRQGEREPAREVQLGDVLDLAEYPKGYVRYAEAHWQALINFSPKPYPGRVVLIRAQKQPLSLLDPSLGWQRLCAGGVEIHVIRGNHEEMLKEPNVRTVADLVAGEVEKVR